jgi:hypothetical protein
VLSCRIFASHMHITAPPPPRVDLHAGPHCRPRSRRIACKAVQKEKRAEAKQTEKLCAFARHSR